MSSSSVWTRPNIARVPGAAPGIWPSLNWWRLLRAFWNCISLWVLVGLRGGGGDSRDPDSAETGAVGWPLTDGFAGGETAFEFSHDDVADVVFFFLEGSGRGEGGFCRDLFVDGCGVLVVLMGY